MNLASRFMRFALVGGVAFLVDVGLLILLMNAGMGPYLGRAASLLTAASCSWVGNRKFTFESRDKPAGGKIGEWAWYMAAMIAGGAINYALYAALITWIEVFAAWPVLAVVVSTGVSMLVNFCTARWVIERER